jgi:K+-sensing histidine kinase KdpD
LQFGRKEWELQGLEIGICIGNSILELLNTKVDFLNNKHKGIITVLSLPEND